MPSSSNRFRVYSASAGSGKTFQLVVEYLVFAIKQPNINYKKILAITFTKKATKEMKSRILEACHAFSLYPQVPLEGRNIALFNKVVERSQLTEKQVAEKSKVVFQNILHNYSDFAVSTIDSFSQRIIRSFAYELKVPLNFEVQLEVLDTLKIISRRLIDQVGKNEEVTKLLNQSFEQILRDFDTINIASRVLDSARIIIDDDSIQPMKQFNELDTAVILKTGKHLSTTLNNLIISIKDIANQMLRLVRTTNLSLTDFKGGTTRSPLLKLLAILNQQKYEYTSSFRKMMEEQEWFSKSKKHDISNISQELSDLGIELMQYIDRYKIIKAIYKPFTELALISHLYRMYKQYQQEEEVMLISEFNQLISQEVHQQPAPFIYEKIGEHYQYFLVDEFQDTSVMQWHNLLPLITESLSSSEDSESLVVGDSKQSIYRFRGGETTQLTQLPNLIGSDDNIFLKEHENILKQHYQLITLDTNYRSREEIINFNNTLYKFIINSPDLAAYHPIFSTQKQEVFQKDSGGYVEIQFTEYLGKPTLEEKIRDTEDRQQRVVKIIRDAHGRGFNYRDIAILTRENKELQNISQILEEMGIPYISKESQLLSKDLVIQLFILLYQLYMNEGAQIFQAEIVTKLKFLGIIDLDLHDINKKISNNNIQNINDYSQILGEFLPDIDLPYFFTLPLLEAWEVVISWIPKNQRSLDFYSFFRDKLFDFTQKFGNNFEQFNIWWETKKEKLYVENNDSENGVQLLSIHKSKGLEFEIVIMPYVNWRFKKDYREWIPINIEEAKPLQYVYMNTIEDLQDTAVFGLKYAEKVEKVVLDNLNLLYVATTRAVSELYIFTDGRKDNNKPAGKLDNIKKISEFVNGFIDFTGLGCEETISFGTKAKISESKDIDDQALILQQNEESGSKVEVTIKANSEAIWDDTQVDKIERGTLLHSLLESITEPIDIEPVIAQAQLYGWLTIEEMEEVRRLLLRVIQHSDISDYFYKNKNILVETPILTPNGDEFIPDRMILLPDNEIKLLDFKSGTPSPKYHKQIQSYADLLRGMGYKVSDMKIVYLDPLIIENIV